MHIEPFKLNRWFAEYEPKAELVLAESGIRSLDASRFDLDAGRLGYVFPTNGDPALRERIADRYDRSADEVIFTCGAQEADFLTFLAVFDVTDNDHAVVVTPTYQSLDSIPEAIGEITRVEVKPPEWKLDVASIRDAIRPDTSVVVVNNPNNPTGRYYRESVVQELYEIAAANDSFLLCDEIYRLLAEDPYPPVASYGEYGISTTSVTKAYGLAGLRFGWIAAPEDVITAAWRWKDYTTISPPQVGQHVARQALGDREEAILEENRELARRNRRIVADWIDDHGLEWYEPVGINGLVTAPDGFEDAGAFCRLAVEDQGVLLAPGSTFGVPDYFRISFGIPEDELTEGLARVGNVIDGS